MEPTIARVYLLDAPYHIDKLYDYRIPEELRGALCVGGFAAVPFGGGNRKQLALVCELTDASAYTELKPILAPVCPSITLDGELLGLCLYMKEHFFCTVGDAVRAVLPAASLTKVKEYYRLTEKGRELLPTLPSRTAALLQGWGTRGRMAEETLIGQYGTAILPTLRRLTREGILCDEAVYAESEGLRTETVSLAAAFAEASCDELLSMVRGERQKELLRAVHLTGEIGMAELRDRYGIPRSVVTGLEAKGLLTVTSEVRYRDPYAETGGEDRVFSLSPEQQRAKETISALCASGEPKAALLYGVTGSGKTSVIRAVMDEVVAAGKGVILLVPEIALTPQTVSIFRAHYGGRAVVIHSGLSKGERYDAWRKIRAGEADVCIGTRSAVFAPFRNLGLIVIDEEQEHTYQSEMNPKYHARDIARYRCAKKKAVMLLASATPSLESFRRAEEGAYTLVSLTERYGDAVLPETVVADLRGEAKEGRKTPLGRELCQRLRQTLDRREQAILFMNQRGYNRFLSCPLCGHVLMCRFCSVSYTFHTGKSGRGYLHCHYCGSKELPPDKCPQCGNDVLRHVGYGTQRIEEDLKTLFPDARVMRMDADTTGTKFAYDNLLGAFRDGEADILLGTQMVTKGHDFPNVTLVGVINSDASLYLSDYRANERTFDLLTQVIGRAGRGAKKGCALIQTYNPDHPVLRLAATQEYRRMYENEIALRRSLVFPPFCDIAVFTLMSENEGELAAAMKELTEDLEMRQKTSYPDVSLVTFGPMEAPIYRLNGVYRKRILIKCRMNAPTRALIGAIYAQALKRAGRTLSVSLDVNPMST